MEKEILLVAINAKYIHSNLAVQSIRGVLEENGYKARVKEYTINNRVEDILDDIYMEKPVVIGFSCYIWNIEYIEKLIASLGKLLPTCKIFLGGPEVSYNTDYYLEIPCKLGEHHKTSLGLRWDFGGLINIIHLQILKIHL